MSISNANLCHEGTGRANRRNTCGASIYVHVDGIRSLLQVLSLLFFRLSFSNSLTIFLLTIPIGFIVTMLTNALVYCLFQLPVMSGSRLVHETVNVSAITDAVDIRSEERREEEICLYQMPTCVMRVQEEPIGETRVARVFTFMSMGSAHYCRYFLCCFSGCRFQTA